MIFELIRDLLRATWSAKPNRNRGSTGSSWATTVELLARAILNINGGLGDPPFGMARGRGDGEWMKGSKTAVQVCEKVARTVFRITAKRQTHF